MVVATMKSHEFEVNILVTSPLSISSQDVISEGKFDVF